MRAVLALDPGLTAGQRVARATRDDVVSAYFSRLAVKELIAGDRLVWGSKPAPFVVSTTTGMPELDDIGEAAAGFNAPH